MKRLISVDAGLHSAGWAVFEGILPINAGLVHPRSEYKDDELVTRAIDVGQQIGVLAREHGAREAVIEMPVYYGQGDRNAGSIFKLCVCIGAIAASLNELGVEVSSVDVPDWKGQLPKDVVIKRIRAILPDYVIEDLKPVKDMWDAIGIGLWKKGSFR